jgi:hypothetical protein
MKKLLLLSCCLCFVISVFTQTTTVSNPELITDHWKAMWISPPNVSLKEYGVYHFRKSFELATKPTSFIIHVSGDNRYRLFVNGRSVCFGPARGDLEHWRYETVDIGSWLVQGKNTIAAVVWNFAEFRPWAQITLQTGFILQGNSDVEALVNSNSSWKVDVDKAYRPVEIDKRKVNQFMVVGSGEEVDGIKYPWGWETPRFDDSNWEQATEFVSGSPFGYGTDVFWWMVPRNIPMMEEIPQRILTIRRSSGVMPDQLFLEGKKPFTIPAKTRYSLLFDQTYLTNAYPQLKISKGRGSTIGLTYSEALFDKDGTKGNRNETEGKEIRGNKDKFVSDGGDNRTYSTLWFRTFRYLQMDIETGNEPLVINDFYSVFTGYPFRENGYFASNDTSLKKVWDVGWRTARLCAYETYFDCPYYEQFQYVGDTRIQSLISLYVSGDDRLMRNAISSFDHSRTSEGLTKSRYPTSVGQVISPFSLFWIRMVHDYWMHRDDPDFVKQYQMGIKSVLTWFENRIDPQTGMIGALPYWSFVDWPDEWPWDNHKRIGGVPDGGQTGNSSIITLQTAYAMQAATELFSYFGDQNASLHYKELASKLREATIKNCWDNKKNLLADTPDKKHFSQHAQAFAVLSRAITGAQSHDLMERTVSDKEITQCTVYFRFYLYRAMKVAGLGDAYINMLKPWKNMIGMGLTTFSERPEPTRSDCHAWSASPNYEFLASVCGIEPNKPGFKSVRIEPHPGPLTVIEGKVPHPNGTISVSFKVNGNHIQGIVVLPHDVPGVFIWKGLMMDLGPGENKLEFQ